MSRWVMVWQLLTRRFSRADPETDLIEATRQREREERELARVVSRRPVIEEAAATLRRQRQERDFTHLVEETFMRREH